MYPWSSFIAEGRVNQSWFSVGRPKECTAVGTVVAQDLEKRYWKGTLCGYQGDMSPLMAGTLMVGTTSKPSWSTIRSCPCKTHWQCPAMAFGCYLNVRTSVLLQDRLAWKKTPWLISHFPQSVFIKGSKISSALMLSESIKVNWAMSKAA